MVKPPLGIMPKNIWLQQRLDDLLEAIDRYYAAGYEPRKEWQDERNELFFKLYRNER
ncbi:hypothetical protein OYT88_06230 [Sporolactobacillus sp. CQH2019]|uniref:hypothetical protein n=1 Tax=Sporolactobacillus sp. CQH2019 TaxID=3023512 RepID=UPI0023675CFD|nr:hypothetical protein [Sporolactobacillus sp. CQH2019]MDD9148144.1 hypothetical protein [Sporolactobacillus sp. CQH2019]